MSNATLTLGEIKKGLEAQRDELHLKVQKAVEEYNQVISALNTLNGQAQPAPDPVAPSATTSKGLVTLGKPKTSLPKKKVKITKKAVKKTPQEKGWIRKPDEIKALKKHDPVAVKWNANHKHRGRGWFEKVS